MMTFGGTGMRLNFSKVLLECSLVLPYSRVEFY